MTRGELEHAIRAACDVAGDSEIYVFGSQAILGEHPRAPEALRQSVKVDAVPKNVPDRVDEIDGALGELSQFHQTYGFYVHGVSLETAVLPEGWKGRVIRVQNQNTNQYSGWCVEAHDLAASKLVAFRDKDRAFVRVLLSEHLVDPETLIARIRTLPRPADERERLIVWVEITTEDLR
jgi:hypothetical protein